MTSSAFWKTIAESKYSWEREALDFVRERLPAHEPYRAWSNFEFIADDGSINEVDLLVFTPQGFFLIEIKSRPGRLFGDAGTWTWETDGRLSTVDNPLMSTNLKAKKLRSLLQRQKAFQKKEQLPWVEALVFCSAPNLQCELQGNARFRICVRDKDDASAASGRNGIMAALQRRECSGLEPYARGTHDRPMAKFIGQAMEQAGIRPSQRMRKVSDYVLDQLIGEGPGYQDWSASHTQYAESKRRVRLYLVRSEATLDDRKTIERAALREFQILESLQHPGILKVNTFTEHEVGPALIFEHDPLSLRLDHYLAQVKDKLTVDAQLSLMRQIADVVRYAHERKVVHRGLCPQSILVTNLESSRPRIKLFNWQVGYRQGTSSSGISRAISATSHVDRLVEDAATAYMAPEALTESNTGEHLDVFSLGALAYHIFSGQSPAANAVELSEKLRETNGLQISSVMNGAGEWLQLLVQQATHPIVCDRTDSVTDFLTALDEVENELSSPEQDDIDDPQDAQAGAILPGGYKVVRELGKGACSVALLVERDGQDYVLKVANSLDNNSRIKDEADVLSKKEMRHTNIVDFVAEMEIGQYAAFLMHPVYADKDKRLIETLGHRLRKDGKLQIDLLQRFGQDLLGVVDHLEEQGIPHRDIKPDNIAVGNVGRGSKLHLVLFDFSLSRTPAENIRAGTSGYLDPLLPLRKPARWDLHAERYAAAVTLYELSTGTLPKWGDGETDPSHLSPTTEITISTEQFDAALREPLTEFFRKAFLRNVNERFHNAEEMLRAWRQCFDGIAESGPLSDHADNSALRQRLESATFETPIHDLGLGTRATNALDRVNLMTVEDLLSVTMRRLWRLRGVGNQTRREITDAATILRKRLGKPDRDEIHISDSVDPAQETLDITTLSVDLLADRILRIGSRDGETTQQTSKALLGLDPRLDDDWPSQADVARVLNISRVRVGQILGNLQDRWAKDPAITRLRADLNEILIGQGGIVTARAFADALLVARGSSHDDPLRWQMARAVVRTAVEVERTMADPRFVVSRDSSTVLVLRKADLANYARRLGEVADQIANEDPLLAPPRVVERLREVPAPPTASLPDARLVRLAADVSNHAALSSQRELYPRGMAADRAIKLSQGALFGQKTLTIEQIRLRVSGRYPEAAPLPDRTLLDDLLREAGFDYRWDPAGKQGQGCYVGPRIDGPSVTSGSVSFSDHRTTDNSIAPGEITPEEGEKRAFEEKLNRALKEGSFLALTVPMRGYQAAIAKLSRKFAVELVDFEGLFLDELRSVTAKAKVNWDLVLQTDVRPNEGDWDKLMLLVSRTMPAVESRLLTANKTMLMIYSGLLARYDQMDLISRLSQKVGRSGGIPGLWLLIPGDNQALIDGKPVPLIGPGQRTRIPDSWILGKSANGA